MAMTKVKNLQLWCKKMAEGYRDVEVKDMAASWKSGLAFCAIIHRFRPDLIDYDSLSKENVFENNNLDDSFSQYIIQAFEVAEKQLNIPAFLEAADMVAIRVPDKLSVVTYVSQYYNYFHDKPQLGGPGIKKCTTSSKRKDASTPDIKSLTPSQNNATNQPIQKNRQESIGDKCTMCHDKVYLLERHIENGKLFHRSCFRKSELSPTSKVFKRQPFSAIEEDKGTSSATKQRKLDDKTEISKNTGPAPDFWQRRAEARAKVGNKDNDVFKKNEVNVKPDEGSELPSWKKQKDIKTDTTISNVGANKRDQDKTFNNKNDAFGMDYSSKTPKKPSDLLNKFKELDQRNLKNGGNNNQQEILKVKETERAKVTDQGKVDVPRPKPRHNFLNKQESMDTTELSLNKGSPKPSPRGLKQTDGNGTNLSNLKSALKSKSPEIPKSEFTRPKTPPSRNEFKLTVSNVSPNKGDSNSPFSPPPLPSSSPPKLPASEPPKISTHADKSPKPSPRFGNKDKSPRLTPKSKDNRIDKSSKGNFAESNAPFKADRSGSPMDTNGLLVPSKAVIHEPTDYTKAVLVTPKRSKDEKQNREVLGGLLKSLANVRTKHDTGSDHPTEDKNNKYQTKQGPSANKSEFSSSNIESSKIKIPPRPKSSFVAQSSKLFGDGDDTKENNAKSNVVTKKTTVTTTVVTKQTTDNEKPKTDISNANVKIQNTDDDMPEWKRQLEKRKQDRARPKSSDLLLDKNTNKTDNSGMLDWQKEAEKRKQMRQGGYVDPEKSNLNNKNNKQNDKASRPVSPFRKKSEDILDKYVPPTDSKTNNLNPQKLNVNNNKGGANNVDRKKIGLGQKFTFEEPDDLTPAPAKPPRRPDAPPLISPTSPRSPLPNRPPPPRGDFTLSRSKHHITPQKIQQELKVIDSQLTKLELKGRTLEDSIRKACEEEEDDLMISWFQLVNEKNELVRKECDYIYLSRQQELETEQDEIDKKLRALLAKPENQKTAADTREEEYLTEKLLDVVNQRNKIVDSIDEDRLRYLEEDRDIEMMLQQKAFKAVPNKPKKSKKKSRGLGFLKESKDGEVKVKKDKTKDKTKYKT